MKWVIAFRIPGSGWMMRLVDSRTAIRWFVGYQEWGVEVRLGYYGDREIAKKYGHYLLY